MRRNHHNSLSVHLPTGWKIASSAKPIQMQIHQNSCISILSEASAPAAPEPATRAAPDSLDFPDIGDIAEIDKGMVCGRKRC